MLPPSAASVSPSVKWGADDVPVSFARCLTMRQAPVTFQAYSMHWEPAVNKDKSPCPSAGDNTVNEKCPREYDVTGSGETWGTPVTLRWAFRTGHGKGDRGGLNPSADPSTRLPLELEPHPRLLEGGLHPPPCPPGGAAGSGSPRTGRMRCKRHVRLLRWGPVPPGEAAATS